jgi:hypothetical protein
MGAIKKCSRASFGAPGCPEAPGELHFIPLLFKLLLVKVPYPILVIDCPAPLKSFHET